MDIPPPFLAPSSEALVKEIMGSIPPAQEEDYSGKRLDPEKREELYEKFYTMKLRGVHSDALLARTLGLNVKTVRAWTIRFDNELRRMENGRSSIVERNALFLKLEEILYALWQIHEDENTASGTKVAALNAALGVIHQQTQLLGLHKTTIAHEIGSANVASFYTDEEIKEQRSLSKGIKELLANTDSGLLKDVSFRT